jgi:haloalkane dehalogenase
MAAIAEHPTENWLNRRLYPFAPHHLLVEGGRMHYIDEGQGEPILFVHGNPTWSFLWRNLVRELSRDGFRCVAPDHIGFGLSEKPKEFSHSPHAHCRNLTRLVEELDLRDITLVVHEFGGPIGLSFAMDHPDRVKRIVMMNTWFWDLSRDPAVQKAAKAVHGGLGKFMYLNGNMGPKLIKPLFQDKEKYTEEFHSAMFGPFSAKDSRLGPYRMTQQMLDSGAWFEEIWAQREIFVAKPTMLLWGCKDPTFGQKALDRIWHEIPLAEAHDFGDGGPYFMEERPREVLQYLRAFAKAPVPAIGGYIA